MDFPSDHLSTSTSAAEQPVPGECLRLFCALVLDFLPARNSPSHALQAPHVLHSRPCKRFVTNQAVGALMFPWPLTFRLASRTRWRPRLVLL